MGVSTDAILLYGYCWSDEAELAEHADEWQEYVLRKRGVANPWDNYPPGMDALPYAERERRGKEWTDANRAVIDAWQVANKSVDAEFGCEIGQHCSGEFPMPYIAVTESKIVAHRGCPKLVGNPLEKGWMYDSKLHDFCKELGIEPPEGQLPGWWLVSYWG